MSFIQTLAARAWAWPEHAMAKFIIRHAQSYAYLVQYLQYSWDCHVCGACALCFRRCGRSLDASEGLQQLPGASGTPGTESYPAEGGRCILIGRRWPGRTDSA
jgi:hypothetical protein